jgi:hypothetical protein
MARATEKTPPPISFRVTDDERKQLEQSACGLSLSAYIRQCVLGEHAAPRKVRNRAPVKDHAALARVLGLLGNSRIANNLNQLAKDANCGALRMDRETEAQIEEAYSHIIAMRQELIRALGLLEGDQ